ISERTKDDVRARSDLNRLVNQLNGRDADRATRTVDQSDFVGQQLVDSEFDDGVRLAAADLHQGPGPRGDGGDGLRILIGHLGVAVFIDISHATPSPSFFALSTASEPS